MFLYIFIPAFLLYFILEDIKYSNVLEDINFLQKFTSNRDGPVKVTETRQTCKNTKRLSTTKGWRKNKGRQVGCSVLVYFHPYLPSVLIADPSHT